MGEFNVDKTTGGLNPTAGMPETYPADKVMMSDGVTSVEDALDELMAFRMEKGTESYSINATASDYKNILFAKPFKNIPAVMATLNADGVMTNTACGVRDITTTGFKIYWRNNGSDTATVSANWVAIGV